MRRRASAAARATRAAVSSFTAITAAGFGSFLSHRTSDFRSGSLCDGSNTWQKMPRSERTRVNVRSRIRAQGASMPPRVKAKAWNRS